MAPPCNDPTGNPLRHFFLDISPKSICISPCGVYMSIHYWLYIYIYIYSESHIISSHITTCIINKRLTSLTPIAKRPPKKDSSSDPHPHQVTFYLTYIQTPIWHYFSHPIWHIFWRSIWHSVWNIFWRSIWHSSWHSIWHIYIYIYGCVFFYFLRV